MTVICLTNWMLIFFFPKQAQERSNTTATTFSKDGLLKVCTPSSANEVMKTTAAFNQSTVNQRLDILFHISPLLML